jgi:hypothetical protein
MIKLFGLTPFGISALSAFICTMAVSLVFCLGRILGLERTSALWAGTALFGLFIVERRMLQVRMENLTALFALAGLCLLLLGASSRSRPTAVALIFGAGLMFGVSLFCYYPQSPFLLPGIAGALMLLPRLRNLPALGAAITGTGVVLIVGAAWIWPHSDLFTRQVLAVGTSHYLSPRHSVEAFTELLGPFDTLRWLQTIEKWSVLLLSLIVLRRVPAPDVRAVAALATASSLPMFFYDNPPHVLAGMLGVLLVFVSAKFWRESIIGRFWLGIQMVLVAAAIVKLTMVGITGWVQRESRDYNLVAAELDKWVQPWYHTGISQEAWLALRARLPPANLHLLPYAPPSTENRPRVARNDAAPEYFDCLVLQRERLPALREVYPWLGPALDSGVFREVALIAPAFRPLPWARNMNYDLVVYLRRDHAPGLHP